MASLSHMLVTVLLFALVSGKSLDKEKKKIGKLMGTLDNLFDKSNGKQTKTTMDVGFLVENPYKHDKHNVFTKSLEFVKSITKSLHVSDMGNHVGLVTYGKHPYMVFDLNEHFTIDDVSRAIKGAPKPSPGDNTGKALIFAKKQLFDSSSRPESRKALIVLTSTRPSDKVYKSADVVKKSGVMIYTICIDGKDAMVELNDVASDPIEKHKFLTKSSQLQELVKPMIDLIFQDAQTIPEAPPPKTESKKAKPASSLKVSKASDESPRSRSSLEDSGRILDLENGRSTSDDSDDGNPSSLAEPTGAPFEAQDYDPTMAPDSLPHGSKKIRLTENSIKAAEFISSANPTMAYSAEPKEDKESKSQDVTAATESTATEQADYSAQPISAVATPAPTNNEKLSMPTLPSSTPAPLPTQQETLSMPSSTPAPLPTKQETLSMPSSTPAPLPTKQVSPKVENPTAGPTSSPSLKQTKSDAEKTNASGTSKPSPLPSPTKPVAAVPAPTANVVPTTSSLHSAKKEPTMPPKELPVSDGNRRSNITNERSDPLGQFLDQSNKEKPSSEHDASGNGARDQSQEEEKPGHKSLSENDFEESSGESQVDPLEDIIEHAKLFNQSDSEPDTAIQGSDRESSKHVERMETKQPFVAKPKPAPYARTQPASNVLGKECKARVDLAFLLDGSQAVGEMRFKKSLMFVRDIIESFSVSKDDAHVSIAVCSDKPHIVFDLSAFSDHSSMERALKSVTYPNGKMFAGGCLKTIKTGIFENSGRHGVPKVLYFMSSGDSNDHVSLPSRALRDLGVQVFSLGLGTKYNARELKEVATAPYSDHVLATRYEILGLLRPYVTAQLCRGSGGKLVSRANVKHNKKFVVKIVKKKSERKTKSEVPKTVTSSQTEGSLRARLLSKMKEKEAMKKAAVKADIRKKLHILLSKLGKKFHNENSIYRSIIYNINGHRDAGCKDYHVLCKSWGKKGLCKKSSKHGVDAFSVQRVCPKTCLVCYQ